MSVFTLQIFSRIPVPIPYTHQIVTCYEYSWENLKFLISILRGLYQIYEELNTEKGVKTCTTKGRQTHIHSVCNYKTVLVLSQPVLESAAIRILHLTGLYSKRQKKINSIWRDNYGYLHSSCYAILP